MGGRRGGGPLWPIGVRVSHAEALEAVERLLLPHWERHFSDDRSGRRSHGDVDWLFSLRVGGGGSRPGVRNFHLLYDGPGRVARSHDLDEVLRVLEGRLHLRVGATARDRVFVHAGVVGWQGQAIMLPGRTMTGKSSLVNALVERGASYYSDEYAVLDPEGLVHSYPRPLSLREPARRVAPEQLGGGPHLPPLPVGLVLQTRYREQSRFAPRAVSTRTAAMGLMANALSAVLNPELNMRVLPLVASRALRLSGPRPEAGDIADRLLRRLS